MRRVPSSSPATRSSACPRRTASWTPPTVEDFCKTFYADSNHDHMVFPGMVYISHPTEYGTLYTQG